MLVEKVARISAPSLAGLTFAIWGLAFKPRTDDMRDAPSITVIEALLGAGAKVQAYDPEAIGRGAKRFSATASSTPIETMMR